MANLYELVKVDSSIKRKVWLPFRNFALTVAKANLSYLEGRLVLGLALLVGFILGVGFLLLFDLMSEDKFPLFAQYLAAGIFGLFIQAPIYIGWRRWLAALPLQFMALSLAWMHLVAWNWKIVVDVYPESPIRIGRNAHTIVYGLVAGWETDYQRYLYGFLYEELPWGIALYVCLMIGALVVCSLLNRIRRGRLSKR